MGAGMCLGHMNFLTPSGCLRFADFVWSISPDAFLGIDTGKDFCSQLDQSSTVKF